MQSLDTSICRPSVLLFILFSIFHGQYQQFCCCFTLLFILVQGSFINTGESWGRQASQGKVRLAAQGAQPLLLRKNRRVLSQAGCRQPGFVGDGKKPQRKMQELSKERAYRCNKQLSKAWSLILCLNSKSIYALIQSVLNATPPSLTCGGTSQRPQNSRRSSPSLQSHKNTPHADIATWKCHFISIKWQ